MTNLSLQTDFVFIPETDVPFLQLFSHHHDYIWAKHTSDRPNWQTESRHPLSDRLILQGSCLYGIRFWAKTAYAMLDIDRDSLLKSLSIKLFGCFRTKELKRRHPDSNRG
jgi:hypothetical protein